MRRRPRRRPVRRARSRPILWLAVGLGKVLTGVGPVIAVGVWLATAPAFNLELDPRLDNLERVSGDWVRGRLAPLQGRNLPLLSLESAADRLENPWIVEATLVKRLPDRLIVEVVEREATAVFVAGNRGWLIDRDGRAIVSCRGDVGRCEPGLIRVSIESALAGQRLEDGPALSPATAESGSLEISREVLARTLKRALDVADEVRTFEWGRQVRAVEVISDDDYVLARDERPATVLVRGSDVAAKASVFELLHGAILEHNDPAVVDLRFRDRIVLSTELPGASAGAVEAVEPDESDQTEVAS